MSSNTNAYLEFTNLILTFLSENKWALVCLVFIYICRDGLSSFVTRLTNLRYKKGETEVGIEASGKEKPEDKEIEATLEHDASEKNVEDVEVEEKETNWVGEMFSAFGNDDIAEAKKIFKKQHPLEEDQEKKNDSEVYYLSSLYSKGNEKSAKPKLENLYKSEEDEKQKFFTLVWLSFCYSDKNEYKKEVLLWKDALVEFEKDIYKTRCVNKLAGALINDKDLKEAHAVLENRLREIDNDEEKVIIYTRMAALEDARDNKFMNALCLEKVAQLNPEKDSLFEAAYAQSQTKLRELSLCNYTTLLKTHSNYALALNNLGVCANEFKLDIKSIEFYEKAKQLNNTLSMANLGYKLLEIGFFNEAEKIAKEALEDDEPHQNVYSLMSAINKQKKQEDEKWASIKEKAGLLQKNIRKYVDAYYIARADKTFSGTWYTKDGKEISALIENEIVTLAWHEKIGGVFPRKNIIKLCGSFTNESASLTYTKKKYDEDKGVGVYDNSNIELRCLSYLVSSTSEWFVFSEKLNGDFEMTLYRENPLGN